MTTERKPKAHLLIADQNIDILERIGFPSIWRSKQNKTTRPKILPVKKTFLAGIWPPTGRTSMERNGCKVKDRDARIVLVKH
jgi:hypothetical protein